MKFLKLALTLAILTNCAQLRKPASKDLPEGFTNPQYQPPGPGSSFTTDKILDFKNSSKKPENVEVTCSHFTDVNEEKCTLLATQVPAKGKVQINPKLPMTYSDFNGANYIFQDSQGLKIYVNCAVRSKPNKYLNSNWQRMAVSPKILNRCFNEDKSRHNKPKVNFVNPGGDDKDAAETESATAT